MLVSRPCGRR